MVSNSIIFTRKRSNRNGATYIEAKNNLESLKLPYDHEYSIYENHILAAQALARKCGQTGDWYAFSHHTNPSGWVFVAVSQYTHAFKVEK